MVIGCDWYSNPMADVHMGPFTSLDICFREIQEMLHHWSVVLECLMSNVCITKRGKFQGLLQGAAVVRWCGVDIEADCKPDPACILSIIWWRRSIAAWMVGAQRTSWTRQLLCSVLQAARIANSFRALSSLNCLGPHAERTCIALS